jgi:hypothetical protein
VVTSDGPANTLPPVVVCPACKARVPTFTSYDDPRPRYAGHNCATGWRYGRPCDNSGELVEGRT